MDSDLKVGDLCLEWNRLDDRWSYLLGDSSRGLIPGAKPDQSPCTDGHDKKWQHQLREQSLEHRSRFN
jgi:hypothetical protein